MEFLIIDELKFHEHDMGCSDECKLMLSPDKCEKCKIKLSPSLPRNACSYCNTAGPQGACQRCNMAMYCSTICQRSDWSKHKNICKSPQYRATPCADLKPVLEFTKFSYRLVEAVMKDPDTYQRKKYVLIHTNGTNVLVRARQFLDVLTRMDHALHLYYLKHCYYCRGKVTAKSIPYDSVTWYCDSICMALDKTKDLTSN